MIFMCIFIDQMLRREMVFRNPGINPKSLPNSQKPHKGCSTVRLQNPLSLWNPCELNPIIYFGIL
jgi:hypothetical protein